MCLVQRRTPAGPRTAGRAAVTRAGGRTLFSSSVPAEPGRPSWCGSVLVLPGCTHLGETWGWWLPKEISNPGSVGASGGGGPSVPRGRPVSKVTVHVPLTGDCPCPSSWDCPGLSLFLSLSLTVPLSLLWPTSAGALYGPSVQGTRTQTLQGRSAKLCGYTGEGVWWKSSWVFPLPCYPFPTPHAQPGRCVLKIPPL